MEKFIKIITKTSVYGSLISILLGIIIYNIIKSIINKRVASKHISKKTKTILKLLNNILKYVIAIFVCVIILQFNGINVTSIVAGLGVVSLVAGLALQDALKDIIMGFNLIVDEYFQVGDVIKIDDIEGKVIELGLKATKLQDIVYGGIVTIANRNIERAHICSDWTDIDVPLPYEKSIEEIDKVMNNIVSQAKNVEHVIKIEYLGPDNFGDSAISYKLRIYLKQEHRYQIKREINRIIKTTLDKNKISIPYTQIRLSDK